jgi:two-component system NarL family response regulator
MTLQGESPLSGLMANKMLEEFGCSSNLAKNSPDYRVPLTKREQQVLELLVEGLSNREIAKRLYLSENTIKKHLTNIMGKFHLNNRVEAAVFAVREKLVD